VQFCAEHLNLADLAFENQRILLGPGEPNKYIDGAAHANAAGRSREEFEISQSYSKQTHFWRS